MRFRRRLAGSGFARAAVLLPPRSLYLLAGEARDAWDHSIAPLGAIRRSVTFRTIRRTAFVILINIAKRALASDYAPGNSRRG